MSEEKWDVVSFNSLNQGYELTSTLFNQFSQILSNIKQNNSRLMIHSGKSAQSVCLILAAWELTIPYVPVDSANPVERVNNLYEQIQPHFIFIHKNLPFFQSLNELKIGFSILYENGDEVLLELNKNISNTHTASLANVLFTSGSTGIPKGVMISRNNLLTFAQWTISEFNITTESKILSVSPLHFDLSVFDMYATYLANAALFIPAQNFLVNPLYLAKYIFDNKINTIYATPTWYTLLMQFGKLKHYDFTFVKTILIAGEALKLKIVEDLHLVFPNAQIANLYGPTETNVCSFYKVDFSKPVLQRNGIVSIGQSCPYVQLKVNQESVLEVAGQSVMLGYWPNAFTNQWYNTGDIVEQDPHSQNYFYVERADQMIKRNGYRVEPGEIENVLLKHPNIQQVAVVSILQNEKVEIIAHFTVNDTAVNNDLHQYCVKHLPPYMVPDKFIIHSQLPLTSTGKTDYKKLKQD